jgi:cobalt-zinc-cadmium efflux system membrane fusion protein
MKIELDKKQMVLALGVAVIGMCIALLIVLSKSSKAVEEAEPHGHPHANASTDKHDDEHVHAGASTDKHDDEHVHADDSTDKHDEEHAAKDEQSEKVALTDAQVAGAGISVQVAGPANINSMTTMTGTIRFNEDRTAHVVPRLAGIVESVHADLGQRVKKGQVLAVVASMALAEHRSEFFTAQNRLALAKTNFEREQKLWQDKISAEQDYLQARQAMQEAKIAEQNAQQKLSALGAPSTGAGTLNTYQLRAPFDGVIVEKHISLGESIKEDSNVFTISDLSTVWAEIAVPASNLEAVRVGAKATIKAAALATESAGTITYVGALLGEQTRTAKARVVLTNPNSSWRPGLFVSVDIASGSSQVDVAVPIDAIQSVEGKPTVFVREKGGFEVHHVVLGKADGKLTEVVEGLKPGSQYAAKGSFLIKAELGKSSAEHTH